MSSDFNEEHYFHRLYFGTRTCNSLYRIQLFILSHTWYCRGYLQLGKLWCKDWVGLFHEIDPLFHFWKKCQASKLDVNPSWSNIWCGLQFKKYIFISNFLTWIFDKIFQKSYSGCKKIFHGQLLDVACHRKIRKKRWVLVVYSVITTAFFCRVLCTLIYKIWFECYVIKSPC